MLAGLIPGIREIRAPLAGGYLWLCLLVLLIYDELPNKSEHIDELDPFFEIGSELSAVALFAVISVVAYLVGSLVDEVLRAVPLFAVLYGPPGTRISIHGQRAIERAVKRSVEGPTRELDQIGVLAGEDGIVPQPTTEDVRDELKLVRVYLQTDDGQGILSTIDRCQSEAEFRVALATPLAAIAVVMALQASDLWLLGIVPAAILAFQGHRRHVAAGDELAIALSLGKAQAPSLDEYSLSVDAAIKGVEAEGDLRQRMDGDPMAAYALGRRLEARRDFAGALQAYGVAAKGGVVKAHVATGRLHEQRGERAAAEDAYSTGDALGDREAALQLAALLSGSRGVEAREALKRAAERRRDADEDAPPAEVEARSEAERDGWDEDDYRAASLAGDVDATYNLGLLLQQKGGVDNLSEAAAMFRRAIDQGEDSGRAWDHLGSALDAQGRFAAALDAQRTALELKEERFGSDHPEFASTLGNLGTALLHMGDFPAAREAYEQMLEITESVFGEDHATVAVVLVNLATVLARMGDLREARDLLERALAIEETESGSEHPNVVSTLGTLGTVQRRMGHVQQARETLERSLEIAQRVYGPDDAELAPALGNLANVLAKLREHDRAEELFERALAIEQRALGTNHPEVAKTLSNLANLVGNKGEHARAEELLEQALAIEEAVLGPDHPEVASTLGNLGNVVGELGDWERSRDLQQRALVIEERVYKWPHLEIAATLNNLGIALRQLGETDQARSMFERSLDAKVELLGDNHLEVASSLTNLATVAEDDEDWPRARDLHERALAIMLDLDPENPNVAGTLIHLGIVMAELGETSEGLELAERGQMLEERALGPDDLEVAKTRRLIAGLLLQLEQVDRAERELDRSLEILERIDSDAAREQANDMRAILRTLRELDTNEDEEGDAIDARA